MVQERSPKEAATDILIKAKIEEAMFSSDYDKLFSKVRVIVYQGRVLLVGTVAEEKIKENADQISWNTKNVKEVANYITIGKNDLIDYVKDTRISLELRAKMLTDKEVSEVNFSVTTENRILYLVGIAQHSKELNKVLEHASNIAGVKKIINLIKLKELKDE
jgi:osmotically-inducible protein OsmY